MYLYDYNIVIIMSCRLFWNDINCKMYNPTTVWNIIIAKYDVKKKLQYPIIQYYYIVYVTSTSYILMLLIKVYILVFNY